VPQAVETKIAVLSTEVGQMKDLFAKLDESIDKMTTISIAIQQMLAVHETEIKSQTQDTEDLTKLVEKRRSENDENLKELHSRITTGNKEMAKDIHNTAARIMEAIEELKISLDSREESIRADQQELEQRINDIEKRGYFMMGVAALGGFIAGEFDWISEIFS
jgi:chromosome segregation ATPase